MSLTSLPVARIGPSDVEAGRRFSYTRKFGERLHIAALGETDHYVWLLHTTNCVINSGWDRTSDCLSASHHTLRYTRKLGQRVVFFLAHSAAVVETQSPLQWCWDSRAGLHGNVPYRPSAKVAPVGCQLATVALEIKTVTIPTGRSCHAMWHASASGLSCYETGGFSAALAVTVKRRAASPYSGLR